MNLPILPLNLSLIQFPDETAVFRWGSGLDGEDFTSLTYDIRVGTSPGASDIVAPKTSGAGLVDAKEYAIPNLADGTYYWSVRSVDTGFARSLYASEQVVSISDDGFTDVNGGLSFSLGKVKWGDVNNDGRLDVIATGSATQSIAYTEVYLNNGNGFTELNASLTHVYDGTSELLDYDGDGDLDILLIGNTNDDAFDDQGLINELYRNDAGVFILENVPFSDLYRFTDYVFDAVKTGDFDNDGDEDIIAPNTQGIIRLYDNNGGFDGSFDDWGENYNDGPVIVGDYDTDGDLDIFMEGLDTDSYKAPVSLLYANNGDEMVVKSVGARGVWHGVPAWGDYDNDGDLDLALTGDLFGSEDPGISGYFAGVYRNDNGTYTLISELLATGRGRASWGDYDMDGDLDLLLANKSGSPLYENRDGVFVNIAGAFNWPNQTYFAEFGDYDNDDDLDVLFSGRDASDNLITRVFSNTRSAKNDKPSTPSGLNVSVNNGNVTFSWNPANDEETPAKGLTYNLRIGTERGQGNIMPAHAHTNGARLIPRMGNVNHNTSWTIKGMTDGKYYWTVQAVDGGYMASPFAPEQILNLPDPSIPVELTSFDAMFQNDAVTLKWETASEINNAGFEIQRAQENEVFTRINFIKGKGSTIEAQSYQFQDSNLPHDVSRLKYRLKQIDFDGSFEFSPVATVDLGRPEHVALHPNYPNPFNPSTEIRFELPVDAPVRLSVYDIRGKEIAVLMNGFQEAGRHRVVLDGSQLASGVYIYVLETPVSVVKRKMVLLK